MEYSRGIMLSITTKYNVTLRTVVPDSSTVSFVVVVVVVVIILHIARKSFFAGQPDAAAAVCEEPVTLQNL